MVLKNKPNLANILSLSNRDKFLLLIESIIQHFGQKFSGLALLKLDLVGGKFATGWCSEIGFHKSIVLLCLYFFPSASRLVADRGSAPTFIPSYHSVVWFRRCRLRQVAGLVFLHIQLGGGFWIQNICNHLFQVFLPFLQVLFSSSHPQHK